MYVCVFHSDKVGGSFAGITHSSGRLLEGEKHIISIITELVVVAIRGRAGTIVGASEVVIVKRALGEHARALALSLCPGHTLCGALCACPEAELVNEAVEALVAPADEAAQGAAAQDPAGWV